MLVLVSAWPHYWSMVVIWQLRVAPMCLSWMSSSPTSHVHYISSQIFWMGALSLMVPLLMTVVSRYFLSSSLFQHILHPAINSYMRVCTHAHAHTHTHICHALLQMMMMMIIIIIIIVVVVIVFITIAWKFKHSLLYIPGKKWQEGLLQFPVFIMLPVPTFYLHSHHIPFDGNIAS
jgi:hypothetical protein